MALQLKLTVTVSTLSSETMPEGRVMGISYTLSSAKVDRSMVPTASSVRLSTVAAGPATRRAVWLRE